MGDADWGKSQHLFCRVKSNRVYTPHLSCPLCHIPKCPLTDIIYFPVLQGSCHFLHANLLMKDFSLARKADGNITMPLPHSGLPSSIKNPPANAGDVKDSCLVPGQEDPLEEDTATHSSVLACRIPQTEEAGKLQSIRLQRVGYQWRD